MLTTEELASIPLFASVPVGELEHLASGAADIQLVAGEYAVHEGEERALFAVLSGKIESASDRTARMDLAKKRITVVRRALQAHGIEPGRLRVEVAEYPVGVVPPREADIIEMYPR